MRKRQFGWGVRVRVVSDEIEPRNIGFTGIVCHLAPCTEWPVHVRFDPGQTDWPGTRYELWQVEPLEADRA